VPAATARRFWTEESAIGQQIQFVGETTWHTIVGIASDVRAYDLQRDIPGWMKGTIYVPYSPRATMENGRIPSEMTIALLTTADPSQVGAALRRTVGKVSQEVPVSDVQTMRAAVASAVASPASMTALVGAFAGLALALGMIGIYGVLSFLVSKRTREIGIRIALGAPSRDVLWSIMKEGVKFGALGITLGVGGAVLTARLLSGELYGISPLDPLTYLTVTIVMAIVTVLACSIPTYRAMRVDPLTALRQD
jgi:ABC-type antimicrobial peptide transport system permease subunit